MTFKIQHKYITLLTACLAYFSNSFIVNLPYVISEAPFLDLKYSPTDLVHANVVLLIFQHLGLLAGALIFSFWVDQKSRLFILFLSVFIYSFATFLGGLVDNYYIFLALRFVVGFGLAPELGIGIVLIGELFSRKKTSLYVALIAIFGFCSVLVLSFASKIFFWRDIFISAGLGGLLIMLTRFASFESDLFLKIKQDNDASESILSTLKSRKFYLLLFCLLPVYVITAGSTFLTSEIFQTYQVRVAKDSLTICFALGAILGFVMMPILTNFLKTRKLIFKICLFSLLTISTITSINGHLGQYGFHSFTYFYSIVVLYGFFSGYLFEFFVFVLEQFGTNKRGSATTLLFSVARSSVFIFSILIPYLNLNVFHNFLNTLLFIELSVFLLAIWSIFKLEEAFNRDLDFTD